MASVRAWVYIPLHPSQPYSATQIPLTNQNARVPVHPSDILKQYYRQQGLHVLTTTDSLGRREIQSSIVQHAITVTRLKGTNINYKRYQCGLIELWRRASIGKVALDFQPLLLATFTSCWRLSEFETVTECYSLTPRIFHGQTTSCFPDRVGTATRERHCVP